MWIPKAVNSNESNTVPFTGTVIYSRSDKLSVSSLERIEDIESAVPFGISSVPPRGSKAVVLPAGNSAVVCGIVGNNRLKLEEGEIGLFSSGGASIVLKNDGSVVINGRIFESEEK